MKNDYQCLLKSFYLLKLLLVFANIFCSFDLTLFVTKDKLHVQPLEVLVLKSTFLFTIDNEMKARTVCCWLLFNSSKKNRIFLYVFFFQ